MNKNATRGDVVVGIVGAGIMGRGIAQISAASGLRTLLYDAADGAAVQAAEFIEKMLRRQVEKGRLEEPERAAALERLILAGRVAEFSDCDIVIEAVVEKLEVKHAVFRELEAVVGGGTLLVSNTSSIPIASIAAACERRGRIAGLHFFNPVPLMKLVEVIRAPDTDEDTLSALTGLARRLGKTPVVVGDSPGFLVNLGGRAYVTEGLRIVHEGAATPAQVDAVMRDCCGFRMGPFELMDLTGIDVNFPVTSIIYEGFFHDRRLATTPLHRALMESGRLGRKSGAGFYEYDGDGKAVETSADAPPSGQAADRVHAAGGCQRLAALMRQAGAEVVDEDDGECPLVVAPLGEDCSGAVHRLGLDVRRTVAVDVACKVEKRVTLMTAPGADPAVAAAVAARLAKTGAAVTAIKDSPGFISQRIRAMVANLGCEMAQARIASLEDIDTAMTLGLNYPQGPLELTDAMGPATVYEILTRLQAATGDDRYRPSLWLRRRALLGLSAREPD